jgi:uncharacterized SAM-dependent methyltransferase
MLEESTALGRSSRTLARQICADEACPSLQVQAICADYAVPFQLPVADHKHPRAAFFPGSSIGNFEPLEAECLLHRTGKLLGPGGRLLVGVDLVKEQQLLDAAYNDADGERDRPPLFSVHCLVWRG